MAEKGGKVRVRDVFDLVANLPIGHFFPLPPNLSLQCFETGSYIAHPVLEFAMYLRLTLNT